jgi:carbamoylphosphate synthase large subunit
MKKNQHKILIGALGTGTSFSIVTQLQSIWGDALNITGIDSNPEALVATSPLVDSFFQVPPTTDLGFEQAVLKIIEDNQIQLFIPILNEEIELANKLENLFDEIKILIWGNKKYLDFLDKRKANNLMKKAGILVPAEYVESKFDGGQKWFMKPINGFGSKDSGLMSVADIKKFDPNLLGNYLVQEACDFPEVTVDSFFDPQENFGRFYCRERIEVKSGVCTKARIFFDESIEKIALKVAKLIDQKGLITFQLMRKNNEWVVTDLNLRPGAGTGMTCSAGFNVIAAAYALTMNEPYDSFVPKLNPATNIFVARQYLDLVTKRVSSEHSF